MLRVSNLFVERGGVHVLTDLTLHVAQGERVALHGPSGCGKTTLLHAIVGLIEIQSGGVWLENKQITEVPTHQRGVGLVFQDDQLFPHLTVVDNVAYPLRIHGVPKSQRRASASAWLKRVGLEGFEHRNVSELSGGEAKRVALARTLAAEPRVVLLDEPLSGLDDSLHDQLLDDVRRLFDQLGTTVVHVTHDRVEGAALCHRAVEFTSLSVRIELP